MKINVYSLQLIVNYDIDDAVGSGATINKIGRQILDKKVAKKLIGLAITGSFKGFDVISEV